jgi:hypothetical protein
VCLLRIAFQLTTLGRRLVMTSQSKYEGEFVDGRYEGHGVYSKGDGMKFEGQFKGGKIDGQGKVTFPDGTSGRPRQEGTFFERKLVTGGKQQATVRQAQDAQSSAQAKAKQAEDLKEK